MSNLEPTDSESERLLHYVPIATLVLGGILAIGAWFWFAVTAIVLGIVFGTVLAVANFVFLTKIVVKMMNQQYLGKAKLVALGAIKLLFMIVLLYVAIQVLVVSFPALIAGYMCLVLSVVGLQFFGAFLHDSR